MVVRLTVMEVLEALGPRRMTSGEVADLTGADYYHTNRFLASLWRRKILDRDPEDFKPLRYWKVEGTNDELVRRYKSGDLRELGPLKGPGPRGGKELLKGERSISLSPSSVSGPRGNSQKRVIDKRQTHDREIRDLLQKRDVINRQLKRLGHEET